MPKKVENRYSDTYTPMFIAVLFTIFKKVKKKKKMVKMVNIKLRIFYHTHNGGIWVASVAL